MQDAITLLLLDIFLCKWLTTKKSDIFENIGLTDLSSWVNFSDFIKELPIEIKYQGPITQKEFLINLGIKSRFENLAKNKSATERRHLFTQFERLVSSSHMGQAFKVMILYSEKLIKNFKFIYQFMD